MALEPRRFAFHDLFGALQPQLDFAAVRELGPEVRADVRFERLDRQIFEHMRVVARILSALLLAVPAAAAVVPSTTYFGEHANDNVKWSRWGSAAFDRAKREDKPIALAVGSFYPHSVRMQHLALNSDPAAVVALNDYFVPVLLDRAEWPLVAHAYAAASHHADGSELVLYAVTPDGELLERVDGTAAALQRAAQRWTGDRGVYLEEMRLPVRQLRANLPVVFSSDPTRPDYAALDAVVRSRDDRERAIKLLDFLDRSALHDILGGGFHHAARDANWTMPYFQKTLDDQARTARVYLDAWKLTGADRYRDVARGALEYAMRDLQQTTGAFNASQHADSLTADGKPVIEEGADYLWAQAEIVHTFGPKIGPQLCERFGVVAEGNAPGFPGKNVLRAARIDEPEPALANAIAKLLEIRLHRPMPNRDDSIAESSGRVIAQLARGGMMLDDTRYVHAALVGMASIERSLFDARSNLLMRRPGVPATPADYAAVIDGAIETYQATLEPKWLSFALRLQSIRDERAIAAVPEPVRDFVSVTYAIDPRLAAMTGSGESTLTRVIIFGRPYRPETQQLLRAAYQSFDGARVVVFGGEAKKTAPANVAIGSLQPDPDGKSTAYVCRPAGCSNAFVDPEALAAALR